MFCSNSCRSVELILLYIIFIIITIREFEMFLVDLLPKDSTWIQYLVHRYQKK